jgi:predicted amidophosphoribosyltransferase
MISAEYFCAGEFRDLKVWHLVEYQKYWIDKAAKIKNPKFGKESGLILDLKEGPSSSKNGPAVTFFASQLLVDIKKTPRIWETPLQIAIVPSSNEGVTSPSMIELAKFLAARNKNYIFNGNPLRRQRSIPKLSKGGSREYAPLYNSLEIDSQEPPQAPVCLLLDDVITSGASMFSCRAHLLEWGFKVVIPLALGKTIND